MTQSRQKQYYRLKNWTLTLYDEKGVAYLVNPKQVMVKQETKKCDQELNQAQPSPTH